MVSLNPCAPIGVFDSGVGGLTVAKRILEVLPNERIAYIADQTHVPYGGRDLEEIHGFAGAISEALIRHGCKAVVMACNISSAVALDDVRILHRDHIVVGMIGPGACRAARSTRNGRIGILATEGTVRSGAYSRALHSLDAEITVAEVACPEFVPLVESGEESSPAAARAASEYLEPLRRLDADTIILGCTHYPFLLPALQSVWSAPRYIDPAEQVSLELAEQFASSGLSAPSQTERVEGHLLATTGEVESFRNHLLRFLPNAVQAARIESIAWRGAQLAL